MNELDFQRGMKKALLAYTMERCRNSPYAAAYAHKFAGDIDRSSDSRMVALASDTNDELAQNYGKASRGGMWFPIDASRRDLDTPTASGLIAERHDGNLISAISTFCGVVASGAQVIPGLVRQGNAILPRVDDGSGVSYIAEGAAAPASDPSFGQVVIVPHTISVPIGVSRLLQKNVSIRGGIESALSGELQRALWAEVDRATLTGSGSDQPLGILNDPNVPLFAAGTNGGAPDLAMLAEIEYQQSRVYSAESPLKWFSNAAVRRKLRRTATGAGLAPIWGNSNNVLGYPTAVTEHMPSDLTKGSGTGLSAAILGDFTQVIIGLWGAPAIELVWNPYGVSAISGKATLTAFLDFGIGLRRTEAFIACKDLNTTVS